jgi:hypothetical protein
MLNIEKAFFEASFSGAVFFYYSFRWSQRAWVKQEVVLAQSLRLICGTARLPFKILRLAAILFVGFDY